VPTPDPFLSAYTEANALLLARPDQLHEALRLLACQVAYCARYREVLPLGELVERIAAADRDPASAQLVTEGLEHLVEMLGILNVASAKPGSTEALSVPSNARAAKP
jgi:hypothetical protein